MFPLLRYFSLTSLVSVILTTLLLGLLHHQAEREQLLDIGESNHVALTQSLANALLPKFRHLATVASTLETEALKVHPDVASLHPEVLVAMLNTRVVKLKFYEPNGRTIFSTDASQIGKNYAENPGFISALTGIPKSELTHRDKFSTFDGELENLDVLASYVAMRADKDAQIEGVLEVYSDVTDWVERSNRQAKFVTLATVSALCILYGVLFVIVRRADRIMRQQYVQLKRSESELRIAATVFESQVGMMVTNEDGVILRVNQAFTLITGFTAEQVTGAKPNVLRSGRHDAAFYSAMWDTIQAGGTWEGEIWNRRPDGTVYPEWLTITVVKDTSNAVTHYVGTMLDITQRKAAEEEIRNLAFYDPLTRLPNRRLLFDRLDQALATSARNQRDGALLFIDLDNFKVINDTLGHHIGDLLLQEVSQRLLACIRESDTVARLGGDEFVVMLEDLDADPAAAMEQVRIVGEKIQAALNAGHVLNGHDCVATPSIGITLFNGRQQSAKALMHQADLAMYQAKQSGRNALRFFDAATMIANDHPLQS